MFFFASFLGALFFIFWRFQTKKSDVGTSLGSSWHQNGTPNQPSSAKIAPFLIDGRPFLRSCHRLASKIVFGGLLGTILVDLGVMF